MILPVSPAVAVAAPRWPPCASHDARHARFGRHALERRRRRCTSDSCGWRRPDASRAPQGMLWGASKISIETGGVNGLVKSKPETIDVPMKIMGLSCNFSLNSIH